jgi:hypothetical protein
MIYTPLVLILVGFGGILLHNLIKLDEINRKSEGNINISKYLKIERFSIMLSVVAVIVATVISQEIKQLEAVGKWLGLAMLSIGYMAQSIILKFSSKVEEKIK